MHLRTKLKNWKLRSRRRKLEKEAAEAAKEAKRKKDHGIAEEWHTINSWELDSIDAEIKHNDSRALLDEAEKLYLPTPTLTDTDKWVPKEDLYIFENWSVLTPEAMTELRAAIRKERREKREVVESWAKVVGAIITILTGLVGAGIGLVAVWKK